MGFASEEHDLAMDLIFHDSLTIKDLTTNSDKVFYHGSTVGSVSVNTLTLESSTIINMLFYLRIVYTFE